MTTIPDIFWHVAFASAADLISCNGLAARSQHAERTAWPEYPVAANCVYLYTDEPGVADYIDTLYCQHTAKVELVVCHINTSNIDPTRLMIDHEDLTHLINIDWAKRKGDFTPIHRMQLQKLRRRMGLKTEPIYGPSDIAEVAARDWKTLTPDLRSILTDYALAGGMRLMYEGTISPTALRVEQHCQFVDRFWTGRKLIA